MNSVKNNPFLAPLPTVAMLTGSKFVNCHVCLTNSTEEHLEISKHYRQINNIADVSINSPWCVLLQSATISIYFTVSVDIMLTWPGHNMVI